MKHPAHTFASGASRSTLAVKVWRGGITFVGAAPGAGALGIEGRCREVQGGAGRCVRGAPRRGRQDGAGGDAQYEMC